MMLAEFHHLTDAEFCAHFAALKCDARRRADDRAKKYAGHTFTPATTPVLPPVANPPARAVAGIYSRDTF
jgi:hypothetical protein